MPISPSILAHAAGSSEGALDVLRQWSFDPLALVVVLLPGVLYARGLRAWTSRRPRPLHPLRVWSFYTGLFLGFLALSSPIDALADDLFTMHMVQHLIIMMLVPILVLLGAPTTPILLGLPRRFRQRAVRPLFRSRWARAAYGAVTHPAVAWGSFTGVNWGWHLLGGAYDAAVENGALHIFQHLTFYGSSLLLWWVLIDPRPLRSRLSYPLRGLVILGTLFQNIYLGAYITLRHDLLYTAYATPPRLWGLSPLDDQQSGGALMWVGGDTLLVIALVATGVVWSRKATERARREEAAQDRLARARATAAVAARPSVIVHSTRPPR